MEDILFTIVVVGFSVMVIAFIYIVYKIFKD